jgi:hypothetical protein
VDGELPAILLVVLSSPLHPSHAPLLGALGELAGGAALGSVVDSVRVWAGDVTCNAEARL